LPLQPMVVGGLTEQFHQAVFCGRTIGVFDQIPGPVKALGGEVLVRGGQIKIRVGWYVALSSLSSLPYS
jgi:hypothetical protein